jgi:hypothetical protein
MWDSNFELEITLAVTSSPLQGANEIRKSWGVSGSLWSLGLAFTLTLENQFNPLFAIAQFAPRQPEANTLGASDSLPGKLPEVLGSHIRFHGLRSGILWIVSNSNIGIPGHIWKLNAKYLKKPIYGDLANPSISTRTIDFPGVPRDGYISGF